jgi:hypothetical protein
VIAPGLVLKSTSPGESLRLYLYPGVRHEALSIVWMRVPTVWLVAAGRGSWGQSDPGGAGEDGSSPDNAETGRYYQTAWVRQARRKGVTRSEPVVETP